MSAVGEDARPRLAAHARLRRDRRTGGFLLLYPERGLALNASATEIVRRCTGALSVRAIAAELEREHGRAPGALVGEVHALVNELHARGLVELET